MSLGRLQRTLKREFEKNPAKTGMLLALLPVAGYFVGPLLWKQVSGSSGTSPAPDASFVVAGATAPMTSATPAVRWQDAVAWRTKHARMQPASALSLRNPFAVAVDPEKTKQELADKETEQARVAAALKPADLGLKLTATIVGANRRFATINGKQYRENSRIELKASNDRSAPTTETLVLKTIAQKFVVLERQGKLLQLSLHSADDKANEETE